VGDVLTKLLLFGAVNHQITIIVVESALFRGLRNATKRRSRYLGELISCHLCFGTWVGFLLALVFRPALASMPPVPGFPRGLDQTVRRGAVLVSDGFAIALVGRIFNEVLGLLKREVQVREEEGELIEQTIAEVRHS
jgi:uncharacterized protein DUF1360